MNEILDITCSVIRVLPFMNMVAVGYAGGHEYIKEHKEELLENNQFIYKHVKLNGITYNVYRILKGRMDVDKKPWYTQIMVVYLAEGEKEPDESDLAYIINAYMGKQIYLTERNLNEETENEHILKTFIQNIKESTLKAFRNDILDELNKEEDTE